MQTSQQSRPAPFGAGLLLFCCIAALNAAVEALDRQLGFVGWVEYAEVERLCAKHGFSERTMRRAKTAMELKCVYIGNFQDRIALWYRPQLNEEEVRADYLNQHEQLRLT